MSIITCITLSYFIAHDAPAYLALSCFLGLKSSKHFNSSCMLFMVGNLCFVDITYTKTKAMFIAWSEYYKNCMCTKVVKFYLELVTTSFECPIDEQYHVILENTHFDSFIISGFTV